MKFRLNAVLAACMVAGLGLWGSGSAQAVPSSAEIVGAINAAKVLPAGQSLSATYDRGQIIVSTYRNPKAQEKDLKIDAVLITKAVKDRFGADVKSVTVMFYDATNRSNYRQVVVSEGLVQRFASGELSQQLLFDALAVTSGSVGGGSSTGVAGNVTPAVVLAYQCVRGYKYEDRNQTYMNLRKLANANWNVSKLWASFMAIEQQIKSGGSTIIDAPLDKLDEDISRDGIQCVAQAQARVEAHNKAMAGLNDARSKLALSKNVGSGMWEPRRQRVLMELRRRAGRGENVTYLHAMLFNEVEPYVARINDPEAMMKAQEKLMFIEKQLGMYADGM
ncbi:MAG TPA: hypothetical protein V6D17_17795 [Candidatus Obscuribacterales bacterium]